MSGLLQRLAGQALGVHSPQAAPRVRSAMSMHAQVPIGTSREEGEPGAGPRLLIDSPGFKAVDARIGNNMPRPLEPDRNSATDHSRGEQARAPGQIAERAARIESHTTTRGPTLSDGPRKRTSPENVPRIPEPLLNEMAVTNTSPAFAPKAPAPVLFLQPPGLSNAEPTEVHVHIGRIDVTAAPEPAAPKKSRAPVRNTLPLSEYLAKRRQS